MAGVADVIGATQLDGAKEIIVASSGAGLTAGSEQSIYNLVETSIMTLGGDLVQSGSHSFNLPRSVSVIANGAPIAAPIAAVLGTFWEGSTGTSRGADVATVYASGEVVFARNRFGVALSSKTQFAEQSGEQCLDC
jgi:hypothetical protein